MEIKESQPKKDFETVDFGDKRLNKRLEQSVEAFTENAQKSILGAGKNRSSAKGFYRLLSNEKFEFEKLKEAAREATIERMSGTVLLVEDTTDINLNGHKKNRRTGLQQ